MKRFAALVLALGLVASGCNKKTTTPTAPEVFPTTFIFNATALPANENPPVSNSENTGKGVVGVTLTVARDGSGVITSGKLDYGVTLSGFPATINFTAMHIHEGNATTNGPIRIQSGLSNGEIQLVNGGANITKTNNDVTAALAQAIINDPSLFYFNIHSTANSAGVARGQLVRVQ